MQKVVFIFLLILFCNFNLSAQTKVTPEEYVVYAGVLKAIYKDNRETYSNKSHFVILEKTKVDSELYQKGSRLRKISRDLKIRVI